VLIANISVPTENLIPMMRSGVVEGFDSIIIEWINDCERRIQHVPLQIFHSPQRIRFL